MSEYLSVRNWAKFQQYKDRDPKWIKLYRDVLDDYDIERLPETTQLHLFKIWLLAAKHNNRIPNDPAWIAKKIGAKGKVNINQLVTGGWIAVYDSVQECTETYLEAETYKQEAEQKKPARKKPASLIPPDWQPTQKTLDWAKDKFPHIDAPSEVDAFIDYWTGEGVGKADWDATFKNRIRNTDKRMKANGNTQHGANRQAVRESAHERSQRIIREQAEKARNAIGG